MRSPPTSARRSAVRDTRPVQHIHGRFFVLILAINRVTPSIDEGFQQSMMPKQKKMGIKRSSFFILLISRGYYYIKTDQLIGRHGDVHTDVCVRAYKRVFVCIYPRPHFRPSIMTTQSSSLFFFAHASSPKKEKIPFGYRHAGLEMALISPPHRKLFVPFFPSVRVFCSSERHRSNRAHAVRQRVGPALLQQVGPFQNAINESIIDPFVQDIPSFCCVGWPTQQYVSCTIEGINPLVIPADGDKSRGHPVRIKMLCTLYSGYCNS